MADTFVSKAPSCAHALQRAFVLHADSPFLGTGRTNSHGNREYTYETYEEVGATSSRLACSLSTFLELPRGAHVGVCAPNCSEWLVSDFACVFNAYTSVGLHTSWPEAEIQTIMAETGCAAVVCSYEHAAKFVRAAAARRNDSSGTGAAPSRAPFGINQMMAASGINSMMAGGSGLPPGMGMGGASGSGEPMFRRRRVEPAEPVSALPDFRYLVVIGLADARAAADATGEPLFGGASVPASLKVFDFGLLAGPGLHSSATHTCTSLTATSPLEPVDVGSVGTVDEDDTVATIMYSSGTSGEPKGIVVSATRWKNDALHGGVGQCTDKVAISYMPLAHGADRGVCWQTLMAGGSVAFARADHYDLLEDMRAVRPRFMLGMSHFWNRVYTDFDDALTERVAADPKFTAAVAAASADVDVMSPLVRSLVRVAVAETRWGAAHLIEAHALLRASLGGELIFVVTGGAHTSDAVLALMSHCVVPGNEERVHNAYGTTEFPGISVNGDVSADIDVRLIDVPEMGYFSSDSPFPRGEIAVRTKDPAVMTKGYYKKPDQSAAAFVDGWYMTGDIGELAYTPGNADPKLHIIDRRKNVVELYVSGRSVWVPAASLEDQVYAAVPGVTRIALCADRNADRLIAVVVPAAELAAASNEHVAYSILAALEDTAAKASLPLEHIPAAVLVDREPWSVANGLLSVLGKVKRAAVAARHKEALDRAYAILETQSEDERLRARQDRAQWFASSASTTPTAASPGSPAFASPTAAKSVAATFAAHLRANADNHDPIPASTPPSNATNRHQAWMYDFAFADPDGTCLVPGGVDAMNSELAVLRNAAAIIADRTEKWNAEADARLAAAADNLKATEKATRAAVADALAAYAPFASPSLAALTRKVAGQDVLEHTAPAPDARAGAQRVIDALAARKVAISIATHAVKTAKGLGVPEKEERWREFRLACASLIDAGKIYGFAVPFWLTSFPGWIFPPADDDASASRPPPAMMFGSASVWCSGCGLLIEETVADWGTFRAVSLDSDANYCAYCWQLFPRLDKDVAAVADDIHADLRARVYPDADAAFAFDKAHPAHLRHKIFPADLSGVTPAALFAGAAEHFATRLALGMPNPDVVHAAPPRDTLMDALAAAGLLVAHDSYEWVTYSVLYELAATLAQKLGEWGAAGTFVGISGPNSIATALADLACALAGVGSFGIHTTYAVAEAARVIANAAPTTLLLATQVVDAHAVAEPAGWSLDAVAAMADGRPQLPPRVVVLDGRGSEGAAVGPDIAVLTLADLLADTIAELGAGNGTWRGVAGWASHLPEPKNCRGVAYSHEHIFTLLYTSGSSGTPKGVMVTPKSFVSDLSEPSSSWPLITVSYIPLSHSSDRMKMWEFLVKGGRVGFAHYGAANWRAHETSKKDGVLDSFGSSNNVEGLFDQVAALKPTAMSCPPRIWNGLYALWETTAAAAGARDQADTYIRSLIGPRIAYLATGGAPTSAAVIDWVKSVFTKVSFVDSYGTTECGGITSNGYVLTSKGVEVKLDPLPDLFPDVRDGTIGELLVKTPNLNLGYYGAGEFGHGWFATGDVCQYDAVRGVYRIVERVSALRKGAGGAIIALNGLESLYTAVDGVADVFLDWRDDGSLIAFVSPSDPAVAADVAAPGLFRRAFADAAAADGLRAEHVPAEVVVVDFRFDRASGLLGGSLKKNRGRFRERFASYLASAAPAGGAADRAGSGTGSAGGGPMLTATADKGGANVDDGNNDGGDDAVAVVATPAAAAAWSEWLVPAVAGVGLVVAGAAIAVVVMRRMDRK